MHTYVEDEGDHGIPGSTTATTESPEYETVLKNRKISNSMVCNRPNFVDFFVIRRFCSCVPPRPRPPARPSSRDAPFALPAATPTATATALVTRAAAAAAAGSKAPGTLLGVIRENPLLPRKSLRGGNCGLKKKVVPHWTARKGCPGFLLFLGTVAPGPAGCGHVGYIEGTPKVLQGMRCAHPPPAFLCPFLFAPRLVWSLPLPLTLSLSLPLSLPPPLEYRTKMSLLLTLPPPVFVLSFRLRCVRAAAKARLEEKLAGITDPLDYVYAIMPAIQVLWPFVLEKAKPSS